VSFLSDLGDFGNSNDSGFWSDLGDVAISLGEQEISSRFRAHYGADHIQAQNDTVAYMGQVINAVHARTLTVQVGVQLIQKALAVFVSLANRFGERGRRGAADVSALAAQVIRDLQAGQTPAPGGGYQSPGGNYFPPALAGIDPLWLLGGGVILFLLVRRR